MPSTVVQVQSNGKAPAGLATGTVVNTAGGYYQITGTKPDGSYTSQKISAPAVNDYRPNTTTSSSSGSSSSGSSSVSMPTWEQNMRAVAAGGPTAIIAAITAAQNTVNSGKATDLGAAQRYISQMSALKDGANINDVVAGKFDSYGGFSTGMNVATNNNGVVVNGPDPFDYLDWKTGGMGLVRPGAAPEYTVQPKSIVPQTYGATNADAQAGLNWSIPNLSWLLPSMLGVAGIAVIMKLFGK